MNKKNEAYLATQQMLLNAEQEEIDYWDKYLPEVIVSQLKTRKQTQAKAVEAETDIRLDKADVLECFLDQQKISFDERYGTKTNKDNMCLLCGKEKICVVGVSD